MFLFLLRLIVGMLLISIVWRLLRRVLNCSEHPGIRERAGSGSPRETKPRPWKESEVTDVRFEEVKEEEKAS